MLRSAHIAPLLVAPLLALGACTPVSPALFCQGEGRSCAAVATSSGTATSLGTVDIETGSTKLGLDTLDAHVFMRVHDNELYVLQQDSGTVRIYDPKTFTLKVELTLGDATHPAASTQPRDFWVDDGRDHIWVTLSGNDADSALAVVSRSAPGSVLYVGLPQDAGDPDGKPEPDLIRECNSKLYVTMKGSTIAADGSISYVQGQIAITDPDKHTLRGVLPIAGTNPVAFEHIEGDCNQGVVATASGNTLPLDARAVIQRFDLNKGESRGVIATDSLLGGKPRLLAIGDAHRMYVAVQTESSQLAMTKVVAFDWKKMMIIGDVTAELADVVSLSKFNGNVYVGANDGLFVTKDDGTMATQPALGVGGTPVSIAVP
jgi:hypothetical protein